MNRRKYAKVGGASRKSAGKKAARGLAARKRTNRGAGEGFRQKIGESRGRWDFQRGGFAMPEELDQAGVRQAGGDEQPMPWEEWMWQPLEGYDEDLTPDRDRAFSRQTVYLVHKWLAEGMPLPMVARILNRSEENVRAAAEVPLLKGEKALMRRYFAPFRMRKETE